MLGIFRRHRRDAPLLEDDAPSGSPTPSSNGHDAGPLGSRALLRGPGVDAESCARATLPLGRGRLVVVIHPDANLMRASTRAARAIGYGAIDGGIDGIAEFVAAWRPLAVIVDEREFPSLRRELRAARVEAQVLRVTPTAIARPAFHTRLTRVLTDLAELVRRREERCGTACAPESAPYAGRV